jgi:hypothetical protein
MNIETLQTLGWAGSAVLAGLDGNPVMFIPDIAIWTESNSDLNLSIPVSSMLAILKRCEPGKMFICIDDHRLLVALCDGNLLPANHPEIQNNHRWRAIACRQWLSDLSNSGI